jgi:talin
VDPEDPTVIAESELLTAAKSIEAAAQKLSQLKPRKKAKVCVLHQNKQTEGLA